MSIQEAIMAFSQSEKIKSGLIWVSHAIELANGLPEPEKHGAGRIIKAIIGMVLQEIGLAKKLAGGQTWEEIEKHIDQGMVMINSGVAMESVVHLTQALSKVTNIGQRSMSYLKEQGLL
ncbi:MAG: hypothetical protein V3W43_05275 [Desulfatiglandaceae bacterium]